MAGRFDRDCFASAEELRLDHHELMRQEPLDTSGDIAPAPL